MDDVERELQACLLAVEKDIAKEKLRKTDNINTINQVKRTAAERGKSTNRAVCVE